jgi:hypothetical protein
MPNLRKTDFERIAGILRDLRAAIEAIRTDSPEVQTPRMAQAFDSACKDMGKALAPHNGKFNLSRFLSACGVKGIR